MLYKWKELYEQRIQGKVLAEDERDELKRLRKERGAELPRKESAVAVIDEPAKIVTAAPSDQASQNSNLETIMRSSPDLDALAKLARKKKSP